MRTCAICTREFDIDLSERMRGYLRDVSNEMGGGKSYYICEIRNEADSDAFCDAVAIIITNDLANRGIAELAGMLRLEKDEMRQIVAAAKQYAAELNLKAVAKSELIKYYSDESSLVLESYMRFRMREIKREWERCIERAAEEAILHEEQMELLTILGAFMDIAPPNVESVTIIINPDGSCQLTDDMNTHVDYPSGAFDSAMSLLLSLAPRAVTIYDRSNGICDELIITILHIFEGRVKLYRTVK